MTVLGLCVVGLGVFLCVGSSRPGLNDGVSPSDIGQLLLLVGVVLAVFGLIF